ncbi:MAG TPA: hypothetical protein PLG47_05915 [Candidatus Dojkabacteria bacterium]|nr:hypothetical protein [Candidatus Dojkabacteria bacterium]
MDAVEIIKLISILLGVISTIAIVVWKLSRQNSKIEDLSEDLNGLRQCSETIYNIQTEIALIKTNQKNINDNQLRLIEKQDERLTKIEDVIVQLKELNIKHSNCPFFNKNYKEVKEYLKD